MQAWKPATPSEESARPSRYFVPPSRPRQPRALPAQAVGGASSPPTPPLERGREMWIFGIPPRLDPLRPLRYNGGCDRGARDCRPDRRGPDLGPRPDGRAARVTGPAGNVPRLGAARFAVTTGTVLLGPFPPRDRSIHVRPPSRPPFPIRGLRPGLTAFPPAAGTDPAATRRPASLRGLCPPPTVSGGVPADRVGPSGLGPPARPPWRRLLAVAPGILIDRNRRRSDVHFFVLIYAYVMEKAAHSCIHRARKCP